MSAGVCKWILPGRDRSLEVSSIAVKVGPAAVDRSPAAQQQEPARQYWYCVECIRRCQRHACHVYSFCSHVCLECDRLTATLNVMAHGCITHIIIQCHSPTYSAAFPLRFCIFRGRGFDCVCPSCGADYVANLRLIHVSITICGVFTQTFRVSWSDIFRSKHADRGLKHLYCSQIC